MGAHRRETTVTSRREEGRDLDTIADTAAVPDIGPLGGRRSVSHTRGLSTTGARHRRPDKPSGPEAQSIGDSGPFNREAVAFVWLLQRGWRLEKKMAERVAYILKTRSISVLLASLTLQLSGLMSNRSLAITLAILAGCVNWTAEYIKHKIGSKGVSVMIGIRRVSWIGIIPWLHAATHK